MPNERPLYKYIKICTPNGIKTVRLYRDKEYVNFGYRIYAFMTEDGIYYGTSENFSNGAILSTRDIFDQTSLFSHISKIHQMTVTQTYYDETEVELDKSLFLFGGTIEVAGARGQNGPQGYDNSVTPGGAGGLGFKLICYDKDDNILQENVGYGGGGGGGAGDVRGYTDNAKSGNGGNGSIERATIPQGTVRVSLITFGSGQNGFSGTSENRYESSSIAYGGCGGNGGASGNGISGGNGTQLTQTYLSSQGWSSWSGGHGGNGGSAGTGNNANTGNRYCKISYYL